MSNRIVSGPIVERESRLVPLVSPHEARQGLSARVELALIDLLRLDRASVQLEVREIMFARTVGRIANAPGLAAVEVCWDLNAPPILCRDRHDDVVLGIVEGISLHLRKLERSLDLGIGPTPARYACL